jgi:hypothetical protein
MLNMGETRSSVALLILLCVQKIVSLSFGPSHRHAFPQCGSSKYVRENFAMKHWQNYWIKQLWRQNVCVKQAASAMGRGGRADGVIPWMVFIQITYQNGLFLKLTNSTSLTFTECSGQMDNCTGALVSDRAILAAAHCFCGIIDCQRYRIRQPNDRLSSLFIYSGSKVLVKWI